MPILEIGPNNSLLRQRRHNQCGVTLVELLVVLAVVAMVAGVVVLNAPAPVDDMQQASEKLAARIDAAAAQAVTSGVMIGLEASPSGYRFLQYERGQWKEISDGSSAQQFSRDFAVTFRFEDAAKKNELDKNKRRDRDDEKQLDPVIRFAPTGETTPFTAEFHSTSGAALVSLDEAGEVSLLMEGDDQ